MTLSSGLIKLLQGYTELRKPVCLFVLSFFFFFNIWDLSFLTRD